MLSLLNIHRARAIQSKEFDPNGPRYNVYLHHLVGWWDFTDLDTMYTDAGTTKVSAASDQIYRINNKANPALADASFTDAKKLGLYLEQTSSANRPTLRAVTASPVSRGAVFNGTSQCMVATKTIGNANGSNSLADLELNLSKLTMFAVFAPDNTSLIATQNIFTFQDGAQRIGELYLRHTDDEVIWNSKDNVSRTNTYLDSNVDITDVPQVWTIQLNCDVGGSSSYIYKQGFKIGVAGAGDNYVMDMSQNDTDIGISIGSFVTANMAPNLHYDGTIFEILIYNGTLSDTATLEVQQYLLDKYDLPILT